MLNKRKNKRKKGFLVVLSAPSGTGKTTLADLWLRKDKYLVRSVSCTTREPREGERHGKDYFFVSEEVFRRMRREGRFLEWAKVHGNFYGTPKTFVERHLRKGKDVLLVIDVQGAMKVKKQLPEAVLIFLLPPSRKELLRRLKKRATEDRASLTIRLADAQRELKIARVYDFRVVNDKKEKAIRQLIGLMKKIRKARDGELTERKPSG